jgi:hypothetical protein
MRSSGRIWKQFMYRTNAGSETRTRKFEVLLVWKLDRFGRSLVDCLNNIRTLEEHRIRFIAITQNLDTDQRHPASRFLLHVLGAAAEFERALIRERTQAGLTALHRGFCHWKSRQDGPQPVRQESATPQAQGRSSTVRKFSPAAPGLVLPADREIARARAGNDHADATGAFQNSLAGVWNSKRSAGLQHLIRAHGNYATRSGGLHRGRRPKPPGIAGDPQAGAERVRVAAAGYWRRCRT